MWQTCCLGMRSASRVPNVRVDLRSALNGPLTVSCSFGGRLNAVTVLYVCRSTDGGSVKHSMTGCFRVVRLLRKVRSVVVLAMLRRLKCALDVTVLVMMAA